ncbi:MAG TPA: hypothetical protein DCL44_01375 [Elusimicrobia bacterium]|nr:hypothetical protein [Elusimicrobiota bacterium]
MKETARLFYALLRRPAEALPSFIAADSGLKAPLLIFALYSALHALVLPELPPAFVPEAPALAFGNPYYYYLSAAPLNLFIGAVLAALLPWAADFFSAGRIAIRVAAAAGLVLVSFAAAAASGYAAVISWFFPPAFIGLTLLAFRPRKKNCRGLFTVILAASSVSLAMIPAEALAIALNSKPLFEITAAIEAVWILWLMVKSLALMGHSSLPRTVAAAFFAVALCGALIFNLAKLLPENLAAILLIC